MTFALYPDTSHGLVALKAVPAVTSYFTAVLNGTAINGTVLDGTAVNGTAISTC